ncbi:hypothetical protein CRG98_024359 [Punica granatum]|uniref:C2 NT-type domain-containing protein n=1 Tax=Punica granatum TaxID=22663 RepID=A0A2I0JG71_PUNGR|nr:hypothetical protein CRG98_024359 [Punica granatum]
MFKPGRWRGEKNRVKAVFKLRFHATQVSEIGAEALVVSVVPADAGKPPVRSDKATILDGRCQWETPIYERVIFIRDLRTGKINRRIYRFVVSANAKSNGYGIASSGSDLTLSTTSESSSSGLNTPREMGTRPSNIEQQDPASFLSLLSYASVPKSPVAEANPKSYEDNGRSQWEWAFDQKHKTDDIGENPNSEVKRLRAELSTMARKMDVSEMELQTMRRQIMKENKRGQELMKEVEGLREDRDLLKEECRVLRAFKTRFEESKAKHTLSEDGGDLRAIIEEVRQEVNYEKEMNLNLKLQLQKTQESNEELILAVRDLDEMLEQKNQEILELSSRLELPKKDEVDTDEDQKVLEELVWEHKVGKDSDPQETNLVEVYKELEVCRREKEELEMQMEQLALDYEILKQENHKIMHKLEQSELKEQLKAHYDCSSGFELETRVEVLEKDLEEKSKEFSDSVATINKLKLHVRNLEEELESREKEFEANLEEIARERIEQEKRAIRAETALRKMQLRNANTADRLQEEFRRLSMQMTSMFDENEKTAMRAMKEASELRKEKSELEELLAKTDEEIRSVRKSCEEKVARLSSEMDAKEDQVESLKNEILKLREENDHLSEQVKQNEDLRADLGRLQAEITETEVVMKRASEERNKLFERITLLKEESEEKEKIIQRLESELESVKSELSNMKGSVSEHDSEKEKLRKQVSQLKSDLQKKEDAITRSEKKNTGRSTVSNGMKSPLRNNRSAAPASPGPPGNKEVSSLKEKIKLLEGKIALKDAEVKASTSSASEKEKEMQNRIEEFERRLEEQNQILSSIKEPQFREEFDNVIQRNGAGEIRNDLEALFTESEMLKGRNKSMETELKDLQERYSEMSVKFAEVEGERQQLVMALRNIKNPKS